MENILALQQLTAHQATGPMDMAGSFASIGCDGDPEHQEK